MRYVVDDVRTAVVETPEKKFPWGLLIIGLITVGTLTMVFKKEG